jgi:hypothetical protein
VPAVAGVLDALMAQIWRGCSQLLSASFTAADGASTFPAAINSGPLAAVWSISLRISLLIAAGLVLIQLVGAARTGGRGVVDAGAGILRYSLAVALTGGCLTGLLTIADTLTRVLLHRGLRADSFTDVLTRLPLHPAAADAVTPVALGLVGLFGLLPAAFGYAVEMIYRHAAIVVLIATMPITATGLAARSTTRWWWTTLRWLLAAILMKPALALVLFAGAGPLSHARGLLGLLMAAAVLWVALGCPWALYELLRYLVPITVTTAVVADRFTTHAGAPAPTVWPDSGVPGARPGTRIWDRGSLDAARWTLSRVPGWKPSLWLVIACVVPSVPPLSLAVRGRPWAALFTALATAILLVVARGVAGVLVRLAHRRRKIHPTAPARPGTSGSLTHPQLAHVVSGEAGWGDGPLTGRLVFHDGPIFRGGTRVCVFHDLLEDRWGATARLLLPHTEHYRSRWPTDLTDRLDVLLSALSRQRLTDRLSVLIRTTADQLNDHRQPPHSGTRSSALGVADADSRIAWAGWPEVFLTLSGPETALRQPTHDAGGGLTGRAWAVYRLLDVLDHALTTSDLGTPRWLSSPTLATALRPRAHVPTAITRHTTPSTGAITTDTSGRPTVHVPDRGVCPSRYTHDGFTTVSYAVRSAHTGTGFEDWATLLAATHGEHRSLALHYTLLSEPPPSNRGRPATRGPLFPPQPRIGAQIRTGATPSTPTRRSAGPAADDQRTSGPAKRAWVRCEAVTAISVPAHRPIDDHVARFENDATDRFTLLPEPLQDQGFTAACLPLGIGPARSCDVIPGVAW